MHRPNYSRNSDRVTRARYTSGKRPGLHTLRQGQTTATNSGYHAEARVSLQGVSKRQFRQSWAVISDEECKWTTGQGTKLRHEGNIHIDVQTTKPRFSYAVFYVLRSFRYFFKGDQIKTISSSFTKFSSPGEEISHKFLKLTSIWLSIWKMKYDENSIT